MFHRGDSNDNSIKEGFSYFLQIVLSHLINWYQGHMSLHFPLSSEYLWKNALEDLIPRQERSFSPYKSRSLHAGNATFRGPQNSVTQLGKTTTPSALKGKKQILFQDFSSAIKWPDMTGKAWAQPKVPTWTFYLFPLSLCHYSSDQPDLCISAAPTKKSKQIKNNFKKN